MFEDCLADCLDEQHLHVFGTLPSGESFGDWVLASDYDAIEVAVEV